MEERFLGKPTLPEKNGYSIHRGILHKGKSSYSKEVCSVDIYINQNDEEEMFRSSSLVAKAVSKKYSSFSKKKKNETDEDFTKRLEKSVSFSHWSYFTDGWWSHRFG